MILCKTPLRRLCFCAKRPCEGYVFVQAAPAKAGLGLYYWRRDDSPLEEEFFVRRGEDLVPVEVKAGNSRSKSLRELIDSPRYHDVRWGVKFADANIGFANDILTLPWFCAFLMPKMLKALRALKSPFGL